MRARTPHRFGMARLLLAPLARRKSRALLSLSALALGASLVAALLTLYHGVQQNLSGEFRRYGANLIATPADGPVIAAAPGDAALAELSAMSPAAPGVGVLYAVGETAMGATGEQPIAIAGADVARLRALNTEWQASGPPPRAGEAWLGVNAARLLGVGIGSQVSVAVGDHTQRWRIVGTVAAGTSEDNQVIAPYAQVAALAGLDGYTTLQFRVPGGAAAMAAASRQLSRDLPSARVSPVRQIAASEGRIILSTRGMLIASTALILFTVGLCLAAALTTLALERRRDFGIMKALGGSEAAVMGAFVGEAALLGVGGSLLGLGLGCALAGAMGEALFGIWLVPTAGAVGITLLVTIGLAAGAAALPWPIVHGATPAAILRGEY